MKRIFAALCCLCLLLGLAPFAVMAGDPVVIKLAGMKPEGEPETIGMRHFGKYLAELSDGKYDVQVFPNSQLGEEDIYIANTRKGVIQMCATGTQTSVVHPPMAMLEAPMLYDNLDHARRAMEGRTLQLICDGLTAKTGLRLLNAFPLGFRHFYSNKVISSMDDLKGQRMRVPNIPIYRMFAEACGMNARPMPFADIPAALGQGTIDGGDSPIADITALKMYEVTPQITLSGHVLVVHSLYINEEFYQALPEQDKKWIDEAARRSADDVWKLIAQSEVLGVEAIIKGGGTISTPSPEFHQALREAGKKSWQLFYDTVPNAKEILESAAAYR